MKSTRFAILFAVGLLVCTSLLAQDKAAATVPPLIRFSGTLHGGGANR